MKPEKPTLQECLDAPAYSAVTSSWCAIESQDTAKLYITPPPKDRKKPKDPRFACLGYIQKLKAIPSTAKNILVWLVMERQWRTDRLIIVGKGECADHFGLSRRQVIRLFQILEESGCLRIVKRGGSTRGSKREANTYALGSLFDNLPPEESKRRPVSGMSLVPQVPLVPKMSDDQCQECHPLPIVSPYKNTHTKELPSAFTKENWLLACQKVRPSRDPKDIDRTFSLAQGRGAKDGHWMHWVEYFDSYYEPTTKASPAPAPRSWQRQPSKPQESACYSPPLPPLDYTDPIVLRDEIYFALRDRNGIAGIVGSAKGQGVTSDLVDVALAHADTRLKDYYASKNNKLSTFDSLKFEGGSKIKI